MVAQYYSPSAASEKIEEVDEEEQLMWRLEHSHIHSTISEGEDDGDENDSEDDLLLEDASSMSSSPSIPDENIDFDLVYALHTFVATVEGQASVVKGDALILLEDTNIYWWLVEVLKTREVGYIPAENIETPYERLARLNKHRNVEITSPSIHDIATPITIAHPLNPPRRVTIGDESMSKIFHYEVESDFEEDEHYERETSEDNSVNNEDGFQEMIMDSYSEQPQQQEWQEKNWDDDEEGSKQSLEETQTTIEQEQQQLAVVQDQQQQTEEEPQMKELRVFAGNIGQGPLFHSFSVSTSTTADELIKASVNKFGVMDTTQSSEDTTIEYYIAVQGMDGDEYILAAQDKPLSIFKTLTDSLTTPMPSLKHIRRISQQSLSSIQSRSSTSRRPRSSSFSNYEQTNYDEDSVIRFYLHRRIKRAHEREGLLYIKVSLYPDETAIVSNASPSMIKLPTDITTAFTKNATPTKSLKKNRQQRVSTRSEIDRIDKIIAVRQESPIGAVINLALEKFHVPDAQAEDYPGKMESLRDSRQLGKYRMSVRGNNNGQETELNPHQLMSTVLFQQQTSSPHHAGPITSDLLFVLRRAGSTNKLPALETQKTRPHVLGSEDRRPSILDILMDSTSSRTGDRRPSAMGSLLETSSPRSIDDNRRPSGPINYSHQERKLSLNQQQQQQLQSPSSSSSSSFPITKSSNSILGFNRRSSNQSSSIVSGSSLEERINSDSTITVENNYNLEVTPTSSSSIMARQSSSSAVTDRKKESFKQQLKRLVGWGASSSSPSGSSKKQAGLHLSNIPPPLNTTPFSINKQQGIEYSPSDMISFVSAPSTPLPPTPGTPRSLAPPPKPRQGSITHPLEASTPTSMSRRPSEAMSMNDPSAAAMAAAAVLSASSKRLSTVSSISSDSSTSSVTSEDIAAATSQNLDVEDEDTEEEEVAINKNPETEDEDIQTQYAMWMNSQQQEPPSAIPPPIPPVKKNNTTLAEKPLPPSPTLKNALRPKASSTTNKTEDREEEVVVQPSGGLDDLYLLVAHGVDFLTSRENTKWEEEGGYEFHPWNRPQSSFAVPQPNEEQPEEQQEEVEPISPPLTPSLQEQQETVSALQEPPSTAMAKRVLSNSNKQEIPNQPPPPQQSQHQSLDDEELQRIVAAHIVF